MRPGLSNTLMMEYQPLPEFQLHRSPLPYGREGGMVPSLGDPPPRDRHRVVRHIAVYQQESLAFGGVPTLCSDSQLGYRTTHVPLTTVIPGMTGHVQEPWVMRFENREEPSSPTGTRKEDFTNEERGRKSTEQSDGDQTQHSSSSPQSESPRVISRSSQGSERAKSAYTASGNSPSTPSVLEDSVFSEPEVVEPAASEVKLEPEVLEVTAVSGKTEQERWRFSAAELISKLQLTQRRNNFTARLGKSLSTKITLRERGASASQEGKSGRRERRCNSAGVASLLQPSSWEPGNSWLRNKLTESVEGNPGRPPSQEKESPQNERCPPCEDKQTPSVETRSQRRQSYCERRQSRFLLSSILYQEYSDVAINRELQRQKREDPTADDEYASPSPKSNLSPSSSFRSQRSSRGSTFSLWQDIPDVRGSGLLNTLTAQERKLQEAKFELVTSEASYVNSLSIVVDHFLNSSELSECLGAQEKQWLFSKLPEVKEISERFLADLEERLEEDILRFDVCDIVLHHCPELRRVYLPYVTNQAYQEQTYQRLLLENTRFRAVLAKLEEDQVCQRLPLTSFLILPFQRIMRLKMLVENILKHTAPGSQNEDTASKAFTELKKLVKECNASVQSMKRTEELIHLNKKIHFESKIFPLISQSRWLVKHGELTELDMQIPNAAGSRFKLSPRTVYLHLFNDCLLLSRRKETGRFAVFAHAPRCDLKVTDLSWKLQEVPGEVFHVQLCHDQRPKHEILLRAQSESEKLRWISAMCPSSVPDLEQLTESEDIPQVQCIKGYTAQGHDELTLEKADILRLTAKTSDGWMEVIRLSDGERGWIPTTHVEEITSKNARLRNLRENKRIKHATSKLERDPP
ncbi:rho guanine nucleotide exchange factor 19 isoform X2 [Spea bombifrons]|uniref:rho guanine nucleotide exchange factor 19 isoform X2 n=1 Tax=Spea bombifrons TaxID=233779 RepID=UPI00234BF6B8|nr:rho guanine nucleotide exchange factor 19 isoform X2 [Spea bombifrons]